MRGKKKIGLSLSGGGYRAAAFHLGTFNKLNELGVLDDVDVISTISGGSIIGGYYCVGDKDFETFKSSMIEKLTTVDIIKLVYRSWIFIRTVLLIVAFLALAVSMFFTSHHYLSLVIVGILLFILARYQFVIFPVSDVIEQAYQKYFFTGNMMSDLKDQPTLVIGSTNLQTSRPFSFTKGKMWDSKYEYMSPSVEFNADNFPLSTAVMASSSVPAAFSPIGIKQRHFKDQSRFNEVKPVLVDGGVYDNQGIHYITDRTSKYKCDIVITSDAQNDLPFNNMYNNILTLLFRTVEVFMVRIKNFQMAQNLYDEAEYSDRQIAYLSLAWDVDRCIAGFLRNMENGTIRKEVVELHDFDAKWIEDPQKYEDEITDKLKENIDYSKIIENDLNAEDLSIARAVSINLKKLERKQVDCLMKHAENMTEILVKLYCPSLFK